MMSKDRIENLPFTTYDLIGYLTPGSLVVIAYFWHPAIQGKKLLDNFIGDASLLMQSIGFFSIFVASYIVGHVISYLSSETSEKFIVRTMGYPISFMMREKILPFSEDKKDTLARIKKRAAQNIGYQGNWFTRIIFLFHLVLIIPILFSIWPLGFGFYSEPLTSPIVKECRSNFKKLWPEHYGEIENNTESWFPLLEYYIVHHNPDLAPKAYNYVVLYGLLRSLFFLATIMAWVCLIQSVCDLGITPILNATHGTLIAIGISQFIAWVLGMAYCKFYRRYSREIISSFAALRLNV